MTNGKAFLGVLAGVAAGAALGLLFAPRNGSDTRKKISRKGDDLVNALNEKIDEKFDELLNMVGGKSKRPSVHQNENSAKRAEILS